MAGHLRYNVRSVGRYSHWQGGEKGKLVEGRRKQRNGTDDLIERKDTHEAIIDRETWDRAQQRLTKGKTGRSPYKPDDNPYLLSGVLRCGLCGSPLYGHQGAYICSASIKDERGKRCDGLRIKESDAIDYLVGYIQEEIFDKHWDLIKKANRKQLTEKDLPEIFTRLRRMVIGKPQSKTEAKRIQAELNAVEGDLSLGRSNLVLLDRKNIPAAQKRLDELDQRRAELQAEFKVQPTEADINQVVQELFRKLLALGRGKVDPGSLKAALSEIDYITIYMNATGTGYARRYTFDHGEIRFKQLLGDSSMACRAAATARSCLRRTC